MLSDRILSIQPTTLYSSLRASNLHAVLIGLDGPCTSYLTPIFVHTGWTKSLALITYHHLYSNWTFSRHAEPILKIQSILAFFRCATSVLTLHGSTAVRYVKRDC